MNSQKNDPELEKALKETEMRLSAPTERVRAIGGDLPVADDPEDALVDDVTEVDSNATRFDDLSEFASDMSMEEFIETFPDPFLIQNTDHAADEDSEFFTLQEGIDAVKAPIDLMSATVYRLRKKEEGAFPHMITVGRGRTNDVFISNHRISKFHAYFTIRTGKIYLTDAHSTNGTYFAGKPLDATVATEVGYDNTVAFSETITFTLIKNTKLYQMLTAHIEN